MSHRWIFSGAPRFGNARPARVGRGKGSAAARTRAARRVGLAGGALTVLAAGELARAVLVLRAVPSGTATAAAAALAAIAGAALAAHVRTDRAGRAVPRLAAAALTLALAVLVGALTRPEAQGAHLAAALPGPVVAGVLGGAPGLGASALLVLVAPLVTGLLVHAIGLAVDTGGAGPARVPLHRAWAARSAGDLMEGAASPVRHVLAAPRLLTLGVALTGFLLADAAWAAWRALGARVTGRATDRVHVATDAGTLADGLGARGLHAEPVGAGLVVTVPRDAITALTLADPGAGVARVAGALARRVAGDPDEIVVRVRAARVHVPPVAADKVLTLTGPPAAVRHVRRVIEEELLFDGTFTWSREARRLEARVNALARDAAQAGTVEERSRLLEEATAFEDVARRRDLTEEERSLLVAWKATHLRAWLAERMLSAPPEEKRTTRRVAPGPVLPPDVSRVVAAGGLEAVREVTYVPHLVVPVGTAWGEQEVVVNALTGRVERAEARALLAYARREGAGLIVDGAHAPRFAPTPHAGGVTGEVRRVIRHELRYWGPLTVDERAADVMYVPFVDAADGCVNAVTGTTAPEVRAALPASVGEQIA